MPTQRRLRLIFTRRCYIAGAWILMDNRWQSTTDSFSSGRPPKLMFDTGFEMFVFAFYLVIFSYSLPQGSVCRIRWPKVDNQNNHTLQELSSLGLRVMVYAVSVSCFVLFSVFIHSIKNLENYLSIGFRSTRSSEQNSALRGTKKTLYTLSVLHQIRYNLRFDS